MIRKKLFSESGQTLRTLICNDCGQTIETAEHPSQAYCPNCGGKRLNVKLFPIHKDPIKKPLFKDFDTPFEKKLKENAGKPLDKSKFSDEELEEVKTFSVVGEDGQVSIHPYAFELERMFSKLTISVTKTLELDPSITSRTLGPGLLIDKMEENNALPQKSIMIIRKAHGIMPAQNDSWVEDSNIEHDLRTEFGGQTMDLEEFMDILKDRYPDAPRGIMSLLGDKGVLETTNGKVKINN